MVEEYGQLPPESDVWHFPSFVSRVVDGDTLDMTFDLGMRVRAEKQRIRLYGVDTAEIYGVEKGSDEYERGIVHMEFVERWLSESIEQSTDDFPLRCYTLKGEGKYGRWLADVLDSDGDSLVAALFGEFGDEVNY